MSKKEKKNRDFVYKPFYEGGKAALDAFISKNLKYPKEAIENDIQGPVKIIFDIDYKGRVGNVKVTSGLGFGCDEEAIRLAKLLKYEVPKTYKLKVSFTKKLTIHFHFKKEKKERKSQITYTYTHSSKEAESKTAYSYKITYN